MDISCDIIRDLLPLYAEDLVSEDSRKLVDEHLCTCDPCTKQLGILKKAAQIPIEVEKLTTDLVERVYTILAFASSGSATYEEILKFYMEKSADVSSLAYVDGMSAFTKVVIKIYNKVSNDTISEYGDVLHTQTIALSVIWGAMMYSLIKKASSDPVSSEKTIVLLVGSIP